MPIHNRQITDMVIPIEDNQRSRITSNSPQKRTYTPKCKPFKPKEINDAFNVLAPYLSNTYRDISFICLKSNSRPKEDKFEMGNIKINNCVNQLEKVVYGLMSTF